MEPGLADHSINPKRLDPFREQHLAGGRRGTTGATPGALAPALLVRCFPSASDAARRRGYDALRCGCALASVTPFPEEHHREAAKATHNRLRDAGHHWLASPPNAIQTAATGTGRSEPATTAIQALRSVGDRLLNVSCTILRSRDPHRAGSPAT